MQNNGYESALAGGCVRDRILGVAPKDFDIATSSTPDETCSVFEQKGWKVVRTGVEHGTVTLIRDGQPFETTTLRKDVQTDGRHAVVSFAGASFKDDAVRRDFTINAMFETESGEILDFFDGQADLASRQLRFVGNAQQRIEEDYLRILRLYRFWATRGFTPDATALSAVADNIEGLGRLSQERITSELLIMLASPIERLLAPLGSMHQTGTLRAILGSVAPEWDGTVERLQACANIAQKDRAIVALAQLLPYSLEAKAITDLGETLRLSNLQGRQLLALTTLWQQTPTQTPLTAAEGMRFIDRCEEQWGQEGSFLRVYAPVWSASAIPESSRNAIDAMVTLEKTKGALRQVSMPVTGHDLAAYLPSGPDMGEALTKLRDAFRNGMWRSREEGLAYFQKHLR